MPEPYPSAFAVNDNDFMSEEIEGTKISVL